MLIRLPPGLRLSAAPAAARDRKGSPAWPSALASAVAWPGGDGGADLGALLRCQSISAALRRLGHAWKFTSRVAAKLRIGPWAYVWERPEGELGRHGQQDRLRGGEVAHRRGDDE